VHQNWLRGKVRNGGGALLEGTGATTHGLLAPRLCDSFSSLH